MVQRHIRVPGLTGTIQERQNGQICAALLPGHCATANEQIGGSRPLPDGVTDLDQLWVQRRDRAGGRDS